jgi:hypothetical protein
VRSLSPTGCLRANNHFPSGQGGLRLHPVRPVMRTPFQDLALGLFRLGAMNWLGRALLLLGLLAAVPAVAQGLVNVNNRGLNPAQLVTFPDGSPVVGTHFVAQILYGTHGGNLTSLLGDPMPFRDPGSPYAGTWNPGSNGVRTLIGIQPGQLTLLQVWVWDSRYFPDLKSAQEEYARVTEQGVWWWGCRDYAHVGSSGVFSAVAANPGDLSALPLSDFQGFSLVPTVRLYPPFTVDNARGGRWLGSVPASEDTQEIRINFLTDWRVTLPSTIRGNEPVGSVIRGVSVGNPFVFNDPWGVLVGPQGVNVGLLPVETGGMTNVVVSIDQDRVDAGVVSVEGTVSNAVVRVSRPLLGRVELSMRHPSEERSEDGCVTPRKYVVDLRPNGPSRRIWASWDGTNLVVRVRLQSDRQHRIMRSRDLRSWEEVASGRVGNWICTPDIPCGVYGDSDSLARSADFVVPSWIWQSSGSNAPVFLRLE